MLTLFTRSMVSKIHKDKANELKLVGYVKNTERGTVSGIAQGERERIEIFKNALQYEGSPSSELIKPLYKTKKLKNHFFFSISIIHFTTFIVFMTSQSSKILIMTRLLLLFEMENVL
ncbi:unnamed protein product [Rhizophagus irregularis]|nr:unnamed protein product [Rhizophagus irregularis]